MSAQPSMMFALASLFEVVKVTDVEIAVGVAEEGSVALDHGPVLFHRAALCPGRGAPLHHSHAPGNWLWTVLPDADKAGVLRHDTVSF